MRMKITEAQMRRETHITSTKKASITFGIGQMQIFWRLTPSSEIYYMKVCKLQVKENANSVLQDPPPNVKMGLKDILASFHTFLV